MVRMVWGGAYDLTIVTDASYTAKGMRYLARRNARGTNRDIWSLVYSEMDKKAGSGKFAIGKVKSHIDGKQAYCQHIPV